MTTTSFDQTPWLDILRGQGTLICYLQGLENTYVAVELKNGILLRGKLETVDAEFRISLTDVTLLPRIGQKAGAKPKPQHLDCMVVVGKHILFVETIEAPDPVAIVKMRLEETRRVAQKRRQSRRRKPLAHSTAEATRTESSLSSQ